MSMLNQGANAKDRRSASEKGDNLDKRTGKENGTKSQHGSQNYGKQVYTQKRGDNVKRDPKAKESPHKHGITGK